METSEENDKQKDLFGNVVETDELLRDKFMEPPFTVLDTKGGDWRNRKKLWKAKGIQSHLGREGIKFMGSFGENYGRVGMPEVSIFDPALCELMYRWFCPEGGKILDPFAGGSVRGIVANYLGFLYTGIDIREEQVESNKDQALRIIPAARDLPVWITGDSNEVLDTLDEQFDFVFSCPPYADLEVYSDKPGDISNKPYNEFMTLYSSIIAKSCAKLKSGAYACFVVGDIRDKQGNYVGFVPDTVKAFRDAGMHFYNDAVLLQPLGTAMLRANRQFSAGQKLVKVHENVLIFKKP